MTPRSASTLRRNAPLRSASLLAFVALAFSSACLEPDVLALQYEVFEIRAGVESEATSGCTELSEGLGFGFGTAPEPTYSVEYSFRSDGASVRVSDDEGVLEERDYSEEFLASGQRDEMIVPVGGDVVLRLIHSGSPGCDDDLGGISAD